MFDDSQIQIIINRDDIRKYFNGKWRVNFPTHSAFVDSADDAVALLRSRGIEPKLETQEEDGNYFQIRAE